MVVTITPNTAIDRTMFVPHFELGQTLRASSEAIGMGGKAADASWILGELGQPSLALGFAAGETGRRMEAMLRARGVKTDFIWVQGSTRENVLIVPEDGSGQTTITSESLLVTPADVAMLSSKVESALPGATCLVLGGSVPLGVPPAMHAQFVRAARAAGVPTLFDASGETLRAGLEARPTVVKPNRVELESLAGESLTTIESVWKAMLALHERYRSWPIVTLGPEGGLALTPEGGFRIVVPQVKAVSTAGAGDAVLAGLAASYARGQNMAWGLRLGFAASAAVLLSPATADCRRADIERLQPLVNLQAYPQK
jgi:1-phosphofructokinase family hexose kinase